jgi:glucose/arabinose dehydrogenase
MRRWRRQRAESLTFSDSDSNSAVHLGLDSRPSNTTCLAGDAPNPGVPYGVQQVYSNLPNFTQPVAMLQAPGDNAHWYVVQKTGSVRVFDNTANVSTTRQFIDVSSLLNSDPNSANDERGLLGMAFHPDYPADPRVYLYYTGTDTNLGLVDRLSEFRTLDGGNTLSLGTEQVLFNVDDPASNHNGGNIVFGPDGNLYIGIGDGGGGNDQFGTIGNGQRLTILLGKMLRLDVSTPATASVPYAIPASNPYAANARCNVNGTGTTNCPEIYAYGFRNPWRWGFDRLSGELWLNDVGQGALEEVDRVVLGGNYGWRCFEGATDTGMACGPNKSISIAPIAQYGRTLGFSTTGGFVYRGTAMPSLIGRYVFADFGTGNIWNIARDTPPTLTLTTSNMLDTDLLVSSFAQDQNGELYVVDLSGTLHKLVPTAVVGGRVIPTDLSDTGCVNPNNPTQPASGLIPYAPNAPFFSDGAAKTRWMALPDGERINIILSANNDFDFPNGSVLLKNFALGGNLVETRLFMRHNNGQWAGYTYEWNAQQTAATRVIGGKTVQVAGQTWQFPSEDQCLQCHTDAAGRTLGLEVGQLNGDFGYPTGRTANQMATLDSIGTLLGVPVPASCWELIPDPTGTAPLAQRARAYLHANCGYLPPAGRNDADQPRPAVHHGAQHHQCL